MLVNFTENVTLNTSYKSTTEPKVETSVSGLPFLILGLICTILLMIYIVRIKVKNKINKILPVDPKQVIINFKRPKDYFLKV